MILKNYLSDLGIPIKDELFRNSISYAIELDLPSIGYNLKKYKKANKMVFYTVHDELPDLSDERHITQKIDAYFCIFDRNGNNLTGNIKFRDETQLKTLLIEYLQFTEQSTTPDKTSVTASDIYTSQMDIKHKLEFMDKKLQMIIESLEHR